VNGPNGKVGGTGREGVTNATGVLGGRVEVDPPGYMINVAHETLRVSLRSVVIDCPDPTALASFYAQLLDGQLDTADPEWCEVRFGDADLKLAFQQVEAYRPPDWPDGSPQQSHLDLTVSDLAATSRQAVSLGASVLSHRIEEPGCVFVVHADPSGHPFCLCEER
jgi:predicted enzyme related to lactoylglutathione lyase